MTTPAAFDQQRLAAARTRMASERTLLTYLRTSLAMLGSGLALIQLHPVRAGALATGPWARQRHLRKPPPRASAAHHPLEPAATCPAGPPRTAPVPERYGSTQYTNRARYQLQLEVTLLENKLRHPGICTVLYKEAYLSFGRQAGLNVFDQNRLRAGLGFVFTKQAKLGLGYFD